MIHITKRNCPTELTYFIQSHRSFNDMRLLYESMKSETKEIVYASLLTEQHHICAYCMNRLLPRTPVAKKCNQITIDHFVPQSDSPEKAMDYNNMLGSCERCQDKKGSRLLNLNPLEDNVDTLSYSKTGVISSSHHLFQKDLDILDLNDDRLREARQNVLFEYQRLIRKKYNGKTIDKDTWEKEKATLLAPEKYQPFVGIIVADISKRIRSK